MTQEQTTPPLEWTLKRQDIPKDGARLKRETTLRERTALAKLLELNKISALEAIIHLKPGLNHQYNLKGEIKAEIEQPSAISLENLPQTVNELFNLKLIPEHQNEPAVPEEVELTLEDEMIEYYQGETIDLGQLIFEYFSLSLDQFPRKTGEVFEWAGREAETAENPFAVLKDLQKTKNTDEE